MRRKWVGLAVTAALAALVVVIAGGSDGDEGNSVQVDALWYGETTDGSIVGGVTPVDVSAIDGHQDNARTVDLQGLRAAGAGPQWAAATAVAAAQAVLVSGVDPRRWQLNYSLGESIDGPSAGALLSVGSLAAIRGTGISDSTTMTGTVLPDGSVGPVTGVAEKLRATAAAGFTRVLVPRGLEETYDSKTGRFVDPVQLGRSLGVRVTPVDNVPDAYALLTGQPEAPPTAKSPPISAGILRMLTRRARTLIATTDRRSAQVAALVGAAQRALARRDPVLAFAAAAEAAQTERLEEASALLWAKAEQTSIGKLKAGLRRDARRSFASTRASMETIAELPVTKVGQLPALADTLAWGDFAMTSTRVAQERLKSARTRAELEEIVRFLTVARFESTVYMQACAESLRYLGSKPITNINKTVGQLDAYTDLIANAADSNRVYAKSLGVGDNASYLARLIVRSDGLMGRISREFPTLRGPTALPALRLSVALLEYVETTQLVNHLTLDVGRGSDAPPNLLPIDDPATVRTQAQTADEIARTQVRTIAEAGLDPSFVRWNSRWGADLAFGRLPGTTDEATLHGLEFQWFAVLQARLLTGLGSAQ